MNKKGMSGKVIVGIIIVLAALVLVLTNYGRLVMILEPFVAKTPCEFAVLASHIGTKIPLASAQNILRKSCKSEKIIFEKENADDMNEMIAKSLRDCIRLMGEGKVDLAKGDWSKGKWVCFKCADITFLGKSKEVYEKANKEMFFREWLEKNKIPFSEDQTFAQYFDKFIEGNIEGTIKLGLVYPYVIDPEYEYTIYMVKQEEAGTGLLDKIPVFSTIRESYHKYTPGGFVVGKLLSYFGHYSKYQLSEEELEKLLKTRVNIVRSEEALTECKGEKGVILNE